MSIWLRGQNKAIKMCLRLQTSSNKTSINKLLKRLSVLGTTKKKKKDQSKMSKPTQASRCTPAYSQQLFDHFITVELIQAVTRF